MPASFQEILNSRLFKIIVGDEVDGSPSEFFVHEEAIAQLSEPLYTLTKGGLSEARAGRTTWKDVSKETFERFIQFAYTGDYSIPKTQKRNTPVIPTHASVPNAPNGIRKRGNTHESDGTSTLELQDGSLPSVDTELRRESVAEKLDDDSKSPQGKKQKKKKKKSKAANKGSVSESWIDTEQVETPTADPWPETETVEQPPTDSWPETEPVESAPADWEVAEPESTDRHPSEWETAEPEQAEPEQMPLNGREESPEKQLSHMLTTDFQSLTYPLLAPRNNYDGTCDPATDFNKDQSYSNLFLGHASLYVLGDFHLIDSLKALALFKLHKTLCVFQLDDVNRGDITDLARYAYSEEGKGFDKGIGGLRNLVCQYMALHAVELSGDPCFMSFLAEGGQVVKDLFMLQLQRKN